ncbi:MAG: hypothetical protein IIC99_07315 [Chloroflexi bacterium]|nr:hypothetical protein [Chloroflexota bacterium]
MDSQCTNVSLVFQHQRLPWGKTVTKNEKTSVYVTHHHRQTAFQAVVSGPIYAELPGLTPSLM